MNIPANQALEIAAYCHQTGDLVGAEAMCRRILATEPRHAGALYRLGLVAYAGGRDGEAMESLGEAIAASPHEARWHSDLGVVLRRAGRIEEAVDCHRRALELRMDLYFIHFNLGNALHDLGRLEEAVESYRRGLQLRPDHADAHYNLSLALLLLGRFEEGWKEHEWRWQCPGYQRHCRPFSAPRWNGERCGGTLLVHAEAGFGDTVQFIRYLPRVREASGAARVIFECQPELRRLCEQSGPWSADIIARTNWDGAGLPAFDHHVPMLSLPFVLRDSHPASTSEPYLRADGSHVAQWRRQLGSGFHVGITWAGNALHELDRHRSIDRARLAPLLRCPGVNFISLQWGEGFGTRIAADGHTAHQQTAMDFADTAALVSALNLVISVDTATAHLAGALGRPAWVLLHSAPDWRWGITGNTTAWYPAMRLFRQRSAGDWDEVLARVAEALTAEQTKREIAQ